jgi:hypothetical protein
MRMRTPEASKKVLWVFFAFLHPCSGKSQRFTGQFVISGKEQDFGLSCFIQQQFFHSQNAGFVIHT